MPNTGKPSQDCHLCRRRRVKCDLLRPQCARCIKYGAACPGYRDQQDLVFRHASATTIERRQGRRRVLQQPGQQQQQQQQREGDDEAADDDDHEDDPGVKTRRQETQHHKGPQQRKTPVLARSLAEHWKTQSIPILLNIYDIGFIHSVFATYGTDGPLVWAAHLFSRTYVVNVRNPTAVSARARDTTQRELGEYLGKTLRSVRALLETDEGAGRDDVLATVWILAGYELLVGTQSAMRSRRNTWHLHSQGLVSILKSRGPAHIYTTAGHMSFWPAITMITEALVTGSRCPPETTDWLDVIEASLIPGEALALAISRFVQAISGAQNEMLDILYARDFPAAAAAFPRLLSGMASARARLATAYAANTERHESDLCLVNLSRSACVKGFHILHLLINFLTHWPGCRPRMGELLSARAWCLLQVRRAAGLIMDSVPQALGLSTGGDHHAAASEINDGSSSDDSSDGSSSSNHQKQRGKDPKRNPPGAKRSPGERMIPEANAGHKVVFDALKLIWPLIAVYTIPTTGQESKMRARAVLDFVGREVGVRQALGVREVLNLQEGEETLPPEAERPLLEGLDLGKSTADDEA